MSKYGFNKVALQETADLVTFTEEILNGKLHFFVQYNQKQNCRILLTISYPAHQSYLCMENWEKDDGRESNLNFNQLILLAANGNPKIYLFICFLLINGNHSYIAIGAFQKKTSIYNW